MAAYHIAEILVLLIASLALLNLVRWLLPLIGRQISSYLNSYRECLEADLRAEALLRDVLSPREYEQLKSRGYLELTSRLLPSRFYRIPAHGGLVGLYENGVLVAGLCAQPAARLPGSDVVAMHKLMIEANEAEYLQTANHLKPWMFYTARRHPYRR